MANLLSVANRVLQSLGTRTNMTQNELDNNLSNEAIQINLVQAAVRDELIRMAPWNCAHNFANLTLITAAPGTPENPSTGPTTWQKGIPPPTWAYEYQYPIDCIRPLYILPQFATGFSTGAVPITSAVTGGVPSFWSGPPVKFKVALDQFFSATSVSIQNPGAGYAVGDIITLAAPANGLGAPAQVVVTVIAGPGGITFALPVTSIFGEVFGGSYFSIPTNPIAQASTTGSGTGATFNLTFANQPPQIDQRTILTNQQLATLCYNRRVTDVNVMDELFIDAWAEALAGRLVWQLTGDKALANIKLTLANHKIEEARKADGNEGLTVNDVTPDWIRVRGIQYPVWEISPNVQYDWGPLLTLY